VGDFNWDGNKDLAISGDSSRLYRLYGVGDGRFVQQPTLTLTSDTLAVDGSDVDVADFNGDAAQDLVVAIAANGSRTAVLLGNANGSFGQPLILTDPGLNVPQFIAVADYNLDGFQDLAMALANGNQGLMQVRNGNGNDTFQAAVNVSPFSTNGALVLANAPPQASTRTASSGNWWPTAPWWSRSPRSSCGSCSWWSWARTALSP
jgi:FG-GAP-like repeat